MAISAAMKSLVGGEPEDLTKLLAEGCRAPRERHVETPQSGADAIVASRYDDTSEMRPFV